MEFKKQKKNKISNLWTNRYRGVPKPISKKCTKLVQNFCAFFVTFCAKICKISAKNAFMIRIITHDKFNNIKVIFDSFAKILVCCFFEHLFTHYVHAWQFFCAFFCIIFTQYYKYAFIIHHHQYQKAELKQIWKIWA